MAQHRLTAKIRDQKGKGAAKRYRENNRIPSVFYGPGKNPLMLTVDRSELQQMMKKTTSDSIILGLRIESDTGRDSYTVMLKELQTDPIKDSYIHADFCEISMDKELTIDVPVHLVNTPIGVTNGGILQHVRRELAISCLPDRLMESIDIDVSELDIGESVHIEDIDFPEGVTSLQEGILTVATVVAPTVSEEKEEEEEIEEGVEAVSEGAEEEKEPE